MDHVPIEIGDATTNSANVIRGERLGPPATTNSANVIRGERLGPPATTTGDGISVGVGIGSDAQGTVRFSNTSLTSTYGLKYEYFPGKNNFYCNGRFMTAPKLRYCFLNFLLIVVTFGLFIVFDSPYLTENVHLAVPIVASILFIIVIANMVKTSCSDPGIIPRASSHETEYLDKLYSVTDGNSVTFRPPPRTKDVIINGQVVKSKYCFTCKMFRPPRASHCGTCDNCVERFDHHCPFLGNCIGKRNYRSFYGFVVSLSFLSVVVLCGAITHLVLISRESDMLHALRDSPTSAVVIIISFFGMWTVIGLAGFHTYLICMDQTTNEDIKGIFGNQNVKNPYSKGNNCRNCCHILCGPTSPSVIDPRGVATSEFIESLPASSKSSILGNSSSGVSSSQPKGVCRKINDKASSTGDPKSLNSPADPSITITPLESSSGNFSKTSNTRSFTSISPTHTTDEISNVKPSTNANGRILNGGTVNNNKSDVPIESVPLNNTKHSYSNSKRALLSQNNSKGSINSVPPASPSSSSSSWSSSGLVNEVSSCPSNHKENRISKNRVNGNHHQLRNSKSEQNFELENMTMINSPLHLDTITN